MALISGHLEKKKKRNKIKRIMLNIGDIKAWGESEEGQLYFENLNKKRFLKYKRYQRFEKWLKYNDFNKLMNRLIQEHNINYCEKCHHNGFEPYPNNKLAFLIDYVVDNIEAIDIPKLKNSFINHVWYFNDYYFQMTWGQGVVTDIYDKELKHLLQI